MCYEDEITNCPNCECETCVSARELEERDKVESEARRKAWVARREHIQAKMDSGEKLTPDESRDWNAMLLGDSMKRTYLASMEKQIKATPALFGAWCSKP